MLCPMKLGPIGFSETPVNDYQKTCLKDQKCEDLNYTAVEGRNVSHTFVAFEVLLYFYVSSYCNRHSCLRNVSHSLEFYSKVITVTNLYEGVIMWENLLRK
jgi:hypothetical protein